MTGGRACSRARVSRRPWRTRWSNCCSHPPCANRSARPAGSDTCRTTPMPPCASGSSRASRRYSKARPAVAEIEDATGGLTDVTIVAHDIGAVGGMERQLTELILGLRRLGHHVTVIARTCELPSGSGVAFHRVRAPGRPFLLAYPWFMLAGSLAVRRWRSGVVQVTGAIVLNRVDVVAVHSCH